MSFRQAAEETKTSTDLLAELSGQRVEDVRWGPAYSTGTRIWVKLSGHWYAYLVSDWTAPARFPSSTFKIERVGSVSATFPANALLKAVIVTLSPVLPDSVLTNYKCFASTNDPAQAWSGATRLTATNSLTIIVYREPGTAGATGNSATNVTITPGSLASVTDQTPPIAHGADLDLLPHSHGTTSHTVNDPLHGHAGGIPAGPNSSPTVNVDWMILHV